MNEPDNGPLTPNEMRDWLAQEVRDLTKVLALRVRDATEFVTAYARGKITAEEATSRMLRYGSRWGDPLPGVNINEGMTDEEVLGRLDQRPPEPLMEDLRSRLNAELRESIRRGRGGNRER
jgi:hypothetical protein